MLNIFKLIPIIIALVKSVEELMPESTGKDKLEAVITAVEGIAGTVGAQLPAIQQLITVIVSGLNAIGVFKKKG